MLPKMLIVVSDQDSMSYVGLIGTLGANREAQSRGSGPSSHKGTNGTHSRI